MKHFYIYSTHKGLIKPPCPPDNSKLLADSVERSLQSAAGQIELKFSLNDGYILVTCTSQFQLDPTIPNLKFLS